MGFLSLCSYKIVSCQRIKYADKRSVESGVYGYELIRNAAYAIYETIIEKYPACFRVAVLCGPGNNGGDGYFLAQLLREKKFKVIVYAAPQSNDCSAHSVHAAKDYGGKIKPISQFESDNDILVIDALFGSGLRRPLNDVYLDVVTKLNQSDKIGVLSIDMPSGICGNTGMVLGCAVNASVTVTFERLQYGHVLMPGHIHCGYIAVKTIGLNDIFLEKMSDDDVQDIYLNHKKIYEKAFPKPNPYLNKYERGCVTIIADDKYHIGKNILAAQCAMKMGIGIAEIGADKHTIDSLLPHLISITPYLLEESYHFFQRLNPDGHYCSLASLYSTENKFLRHLHLKLLDYFMKNTNVKAVLDVDLEYLYSLEKEMTFNNNIVFLIHETDFIKSCSDLKDLDKISQAHFIAQKYNVTLIYKGVDTIIVSPDRQCVIQTRPIFNTATSASGYCLLGILAGLMARNMPSFKACCAGVALHADAFEKAPLYSTAQEILPYLSLPDSLHFKI